MVASSKTVNRKRWDKEGIRWKSLQQAVQDLGSLGNLDHVDLLPLQVKGLFHAHVRILSSGAILRIPRVSSLDLSPNENLLYQAVSFKRGSLSGHIPKLIDTIFPRDGLPWGALVIEDIEGQTPILPENLISIAKALAAIHRLPVPVVNSRSPILFHNNPIIATMAIIREQAKFLREANINREAESQLQEEILLAEKNALSLSCLNMPITFVGTDTHPGNFLIDSDERAVFVDIEKCTYGSPAIDLAHATLYTSTMWDPEISVVLSTDEVSQFYQCYFDNLPSDLARSIMPFCSPMQRFTWLRTMTWCAKWRVQSKSGKDWSPTCSDPLYVDLVNKRIDDYFSPATIEQVRVEFGKNFSFETK